MTQPFKFRFVNEIAGAFVLGAIVLLAVAIFLAGRAQGFFESKFTLQAEFATEEGSFGLQKGSDIRIRDAVAGTVSSIVPSTNGILTATMVIKESFHPFVRTSSKAVVKKALIITGDAYVDILSGNMNDPVMPENSMIKCVKDTQIIEQATRLIDDLHTNTIPILKQTKAVLDEVAPLAAQARNTLHEGESILKNNVPAVLLQAQDTLRSAQTTLEALQRHWFLRKYVEPYDSSRVISPASVSLPAAGEKAPGGAP
ncbi:MAG: MlaD family protein [Kiritimatiellia bacterium]